MSRPRGFKPWQRMERAEPINPPGYSGKAPTGQFWMNDRYTVIENTMPDGTTHLSIRRNDRDFPRDWRHFQRIKNDICGPEREGAELFPAESRLLDGANQFHIWVLPEGQTIPLGYNQVTHVRSVLDHDDPLVRNIGNARQRPLNQESK